MPTEKQIASTFIRVGNRREADHNRAAIEDRMRSPPSLINTSHSRSGQIAYEFQPQGAGLVVDVIFERSSLTVSILSFFVVQFCCRANSAFNPHSLC